VALLLAAVGIYGLTSYSAQQRTRELGIGIALGAAPSQVRNMIVTGDRRPYMTTLVYGVKTTDVAVTSAAALAHSLVALVATYVPARRATRLDPVEILPLRIADACVYSSVRRVFYFMCRATRIVS